MKIKKNEEILSELLDEADEVSSSQMLNNLYIEGSLHISLLSCDIFHDNDIPNKPYIGENLKSPNFTGTEQEAQKLQTGLIVEDLNIMKQKREALEIRELAQHNNYKALIYQRELYIFLNRLAIKLIRLSSKKVAILNIELLQRVTLVLILEAGFRARRLIDLLASISTDKNNKGASAFLQTIKDEYSLIENLRDKEAKIYKEKIDHQDELIIEILSKGIGDKYENSEKIFKEIKIKFAKHLETVVDSVKNEKEIYVVFKYTIISIGLEKEFPLGFDFLSFYENQEIQSSEKDLLNQIKSQLIKYL
jgi:hypothetical protein